MSLQQNINIKNKRAGFDYEFIDKFIAGMVLMGTEIKSIRAGKVSMNDSYCFFEAGELYIKNLSISEYEYGTRYNHEVRRERKLLLSRRELNKLDRKVRETGLTIVPTRLFINEKGLAKLEIALARGKATYDKRQSLKEKDARREMDREHK
jgi:SsrA-binding protein